MCISPLVSGDQHEGKTDGSEAAVARPARSQPATAATSAAAATASATGGCAAEEVQEQRRRAEFPLAAAAYAADYESEVAGAAVAAAESRHAVAIPAGT